MKTHLTGDAVSVKLRHTLQNLRFQTRCTSMAVEAGPSLAPSSWFRRATPGLTRTGLTHAGSSPILSKLPSQSVPSVGCSLAPSG
jgi:hypothetical protein